MHRCRCMACLTLHNCNLLPSARVEQACALLRPAVLWLLGPHHTAGHSRAVLGERDACSAAGTTHNVNWVGGLTQGIRLQVAFAKPASTCNWMCGPLDCSGRSSLWPWPYCYALLDQYSLMALFRALHLEICVLEWRTSLHWFTGSPARSLVLIKP